MQATTPPFKIRHIPLYGFTSIEHFVDFLVGEQQIKSGMLVAVNAEKLMLAERDPELRKILLKSEYNYPDGISIVQALRRKYAGQQIVRTAGIDLWLALMTRCAQQKIPVYLVGATPSILQQTKQKLQQEMGVTLTGWQHGYFTRNEAENVIKSITDSSARVVIVAMGSPRQELFIRQCQKRYPEALYMGVGGSYDVFTGHVRRAPLLWRHWGLEWLYRLICQPSRWRRQIKLLRFVWYYWRKQL